MADVFLVFPETMQNLDKFGGYVLILSDLKNN